MLEAVNGKPRFLFLVMFAALNALQLIICLALAMMVIPAWSADPDTATSVNDGREPRLSAGSTHRHQRSEKPITHSASAVPAGQSQQRDTTRKREQASAPPDTGADKAKPDGRSAVVPWPPMDNRVRVETPTRLNQSTCAILKKAAKRHGLPLEFFARVIWTESRFKPNAIGPTTRTGHRAQGIAQFMPYTATARGLADPFDPQLALPEAAEFLAELRREFGNLGLAAAAYNAGPGRVHKFLNRLGGMPAETRHYVRAITGRSVEEWAAFGREKRKKGVAASTSCRVLAALVRERPVFSIRIVDRAAYEATIGLGDSLDLQQKMVRVEGSAPPPALDLAKASATVAALETVEGSANLSALKQVRVSKVRQRSRGRKTLAKGKYPIRVKGRLVALDTRGAPNGLAASARLRNVSPKLRARSAGRVKFQKFNARRLRAMSARRRLRTARDARIDKIMRICSGCGL